MWILEWLPVDDQKAPWRTFGLSHPLNEIEERLKDVEQRLPHALWRIVPAS